MREQVILITGANGEIGHGLIRYLAEQNCPIVTLDVNPLDKALRPLVSKWIVGDVLDQILLGRLVGAPNPHDLPSRFHSFHQS